MDWNEETISHLRRLWDQGLSTAEIGRRMAITKNAVVGKAHRLDLPSRPSPIRKSLDGQAPLVRRERKHRATIEEVGKTAGGRSTAVRLADFPKPADGSGEPRRPAGESATITPIRPHPPAQPEAARPSLGLEPRRRGLTCCWPLGEPGTKGFHFCGGEPLQGKPYCSEHAQLAYVKLRDRRDTVA